eukprot:UN04629
MFCNRHGQDLHIASDSLWDAWANLRFHDLYLSKDYALLVASILSALAYWLFNIRTRILYLSKFRFAVNNVDIHNRTLFRRLFKWWVLMHLILVPYSIYTVLLEAPVFPIHRSHLMMALFVSFELKMYLALTPDIENWSYVFSTKSYLLEKYYVFSFCFISPLG